MMIIVNSSIPTQPIPKQLDALGAEPYSSDPSVLNTTFSSSSQSESRNLAELADSNSLCLDLLEAAFSHLDSTAAATVNHMLHNPNLEQEMDELAALTRKYNLEATN